ncbi:MAG: hypothetical protein ACK5P5_12050 [Pseudobdellovibrionaceae bacterium]
MLTDGSLISIGPLPTITQDKVANNYTSDPYIVEYGGDCENGLLVFVTGDITASTLCSSGKWTYTASKADPGVVNLVFSQTNTNGTSTLDCQWTVTPPVNRFYMGDGSSLTSPTYDPMNDPTYSSNVLKLSHSHNAFCAVLSTGKIYCWGENWGPSKPPEISASLPTTGFIDVASNWWFQLGLRNNGDVWRWTSGGQFGIDGIQVNIPLGVKLATLVSGSAFCVLTSAGQVLCSGENYAGILGDGTTIDAIGSTVQPVGLSSNVIDISSPDRGGETFLCALKTGGEVYCWGTLGGVSLGLTPNLIHTDVDVVQISTGYQSVCIRRSTGTVACRGSQYGNSLAFTEITGLSGTISSISYCGDGSNCAFTTTGKAFLLSTSAATALGPFSANVSGYRVLGSTECFIHRGQVKCSGANNNSLLGNSGSLTNTPTESDAVSYIFSSNIVSIQAIEENQGGCALDSNSDLWCWGKNYPGIIAAGTSATSTPQKVFTGVQSIVPSGDYTSTIDVIKSGVVYTGSASGFVSAQSWLSSNVTKISYGYPNKCALFSDGSVKCSFAFDELSAGVATCVGADCAAPQTPTGLGSNVIDVSVGYNLGCAIKSAAMSTTQLWCWGYMFPSNPLPFQMTSYPNDLTAIYVGYAYLCAYSISQGLVCSDNSMAVPTPMPNSMGLNTSTLVIRGSTVEFTQGGTHYVNGIVGTGSTWDYLYVQEGGGGIGEKNCKIIGALVKCWSGTSWAALGQTWMAGVAVAPYYYAVDPVAAHLID